MAKLHRNQSKVRMQLLGVPHSIKRLKQYRKELQLGSEIGIIKGAYYFLEESNKVTPMDTGELRASGKVTITGKGFKTKARIEYTARYAIYVHEDLTKWHAPGTYAKFLERTINEKRLQYTAIINFEARKRLPKARRWPKPKFRY